ncbi:MAG: chorismate synthase, partial [Prevotellaceae bacterium]|nr:chorismate synthase [Prevotellaceae bacterium]
MNSFGRIFRIQIFGESHGPYVGVTIDGCPAGLSLSIDDFEDDLSRRCSGAPGTTGRHE